MGVFIINISPSDTFGTIAFTLKISPKIVTLLLETVSISGLDMYSFEYVWTSNSLCQ